MKVDNIFSLMSERGISSKELSKQTGISSGNISDWKSGRSTPKADNLAKIADYFNVSVDYLLGRTNSPNKVSISREEFEIETTSVDISIQNLSEAQRAMLKCRINQLMVNKFRTEDFFEKLDEELDVDNSFVWFERLNDFSLDDKIPQMLNYLNVQMGSLFKTMSIVIKTKAVAKALSINYSEDAIFPIIVSGDKIFSALSVLSIASLSALEKELLEQIEIKPRTLSSDIEDDLRSELKSSFKSKLQV